ncbi:MAG: hypothetical protein OXG46_00750 [Chloroflexi bacterium]|nr:hypothetical protein [Chloroflexota bacterium]MCY3937034.1 hypothetical protein [Chloroflexota bacterium]
MSGNKEKGNSFTRRVQDHLARIGLSVQPEYAVEVSVNGRHKKMHKFDFGNDSLLVECKAYDWTAGGNYPSAKISTINEAMLYFVAAPKSYRKMIFISATEKKGVRNPETLPEHYVRRYGHFIPGDVEVYELDAEDLSSKRVWPRRKVSEKGLKDISATAYQDSKSRQASLQSSSRQAPTAHCERAKDLCAPPIFHLRLGARYYNDGFFNVTREYDQYVRPTDGPVTLILGGFGELQARVNRRANMNGTARIHCGARLRDWFKDSGYVQGQTVPVTFETPDRIRLG